MLHRISTYFFSDYRLHTQSRWFKKLLYLFLLGESFYCLFYFDLLFGKNSIVLVTPKFIGVFKGLAFLLYNTNSETLSLVFILCTSLLSLFNLYVERFRLPVDILLWFLAFNIHNRIYPMLTGGDNLLHQFLIFNCFLSSTYKKEESWWGRLKQCVHNMSLLALHIQVCLVYVLSALAKLSDPYWLSGEAVLIVSQVKHFALFSFLSGGAAAAFLYMVVNYIVLFYQLLFPLFVWMPVLKKPFLVVGILMHIYIALVMGLVGFGMIMIIAYTLFWPTKPAIK